jgi:acyl transferase domain-containing protein
MTTEHDTAIAVIGSACRLPAAPDPGAFWDLLRTGAHALTGLPSGRRWSGSPRPGHGAFLDQIDEFDAAFFGVSPREAATLDPQQRFWRSAGTRLRRPGSCRPSWPTPTPGSSPWR